MRIFQIFYPKSFSDFLQLFDFGVFIGIHRLYLGFHQKFFLRCYLLGFLSIITLKNYPQIQLEIPPRNILQEYIYEFILAFFQRFFQRSFINYSGFPLLILSAINPKKSSSYLFINFSGLTPRLNTRIPPEIAIKFAITFQRFLQKFI